jgi:hypothetical protein
VTFQVLPPSTLHIFFLFGLLLGSWLKEGSRMAFLCVLLYVHFRQIGFIRRWHLTMIEQNSWNLKWRNNRHRESNSWQVTFISVSIPSSLPVLCSILTLRGPWIVIYEYSYNKSQREAIISQIYSRNRTLHVSDSSSVHHQESSTVHTAIGICYTDYADSLLVGSGWNLLLCV